MGTQGYRHNEQNFFHYDNYCVSQTHKAKTAMCHYESYKLFEMLRAIQQFIEPTSLLPCSQEPAIGLLLKPDYSSLHPHAHFNIILPYVTPLSRNVFPQMSLPKL
jgi:hypothetical protein